MCQQRIGLIAARTQARITRRGKILLLTRLKARAELAPLPALRMRDWMVHWLPESHGAHRRWIFLHCFNNWELLSEGKTPLGSQRNSEAPHLARVRTFPLVTVLGTVYGLLSQAFGGRILAAARV